MPFFFTERGQQMLRVGLETMRSQSRTEVAETSARGFLELERHITSAISSGPVVATEEDHPWPAEHDRLVEMLRSAGRTNLPPD